MATATEVVPEPESVTVAGLKVQVMAEEAGKLRGDRDCPGGAFGAVCEGARFAWGSVACPGTRRPGEGVCEG